MATDFSPTSGRALLFASQLLGRGGRIRLLHVLDARLQRDLSILLGVEKAARASLDAARRALRARGVRCDARLEWGKPEAVIVREAKALRASAVVCGTHGRRGVVRMLLGSVAERVLQTSARPVLLVPHVSFRRAIRRVLVAMDFSPVSGAALGSAEALCASGEADLHVVHVLDPGLGAAYAFSAHPGFFEEMRRRREEAARLFEEIRRRLSRRGVAHVLHLEQGDPAEKILRLADKVNPDLLVVGTGGRRGFLRLFVGSVARRVVRGTPCPLLATPPE